MNIPELTTNSLLMLHSAVRQALETDDNLPEGTEKIHEVRKSPDWREWSNLIEDELDNRSIRYEKISWE